LKIVVNDTSVGSVVGMMCPQKMVDMAKIGHVLADVSKKHKIPVVGCLMGGKSMDSGRAVLFERNIPCFDNPEEAVLVLDVLGDYYHDYCKRKLYRQSKATPKISHFPSAMLQKALNKGSKALDEQSGMKLLKCYGIPIVSAMLAKHKKDAVIKAKKIGYPVVLKIAQWPSSNP